MNAWRPMCVIVLLSACGDASGPLPLVGTLERDRLELVAEASEPILDILATEGQAVESGQLLVRLETALQQAELAAARAAREMAAQRVAELVRGPRAERIDAARARLAGARDHLEIQREEFRRVEELRELGLISESEVDRQRNDLDAAVAAADALDAELDELLAGTTSEELAQAQAALAQTEARVEQARLILMRMEVRAPRAGRVEALPFEVGERPPARAPLVVMLADTAPFARVFVPETLRSRVQPGLEARVTVDGIDAVFAGRVRYVAADAAFTPYFALTQRDRSRLTFLAEIVLDEQAAEQLPSGVPVQVTFPTVQ